MEITQERVNTFAEATGDYQWIHIDVERASGRPPLRRHHRPRLPHAVARELLPPADRGYEGFSLAVNYGVDKVRFIAPVLVGKRIRAGAEMIEVTDVKGGGMQTKVLITIEIEGSEKPACVIESLARWIVAGHPSCSPHEWAAPADDHFFRSRPLACRHPSFAERR